MGTWSLGRVLIRWPEGHPQHGLEVWMRRKRIAETLDVAGGLPAITDEEFAALPLDERAAHVRRMYLDRVDSLAELLISWNFTEVEYDEAGQPTGEEASVPATAEGALQLDEITFGEIWRAYNEATTRVSPPLPQPSDGGEPSEEALRLPQEPL